LHQVENISRSRGDKPRSQAAPAPIREKVDDLMPLEVNQDAAVGAPAAKGEVVHAEHAEHAEHARREQCGRRIRADAGKQRVATDRDAKSLQQTRSRLATQREGNMPQPVAQAVGAPRLRYTSNTSRSSHSIADSWIAI
jgi:hypothetical protein